MRGMSESRRILIVEDEPAIADTLVYALKTEGFAPEWCATGRAGLAALVAKPYALVVLDVGLPDGTGFDVCKAIRMQSNLGARVPAHCCSEGKAMLAYRPAEIIERVIAGGLAPCTPKTIVKPQRLREELASVRARGFALDDEELEIGLRSAAAPIRDHRGDVIAAVSVAGPVQRVDRKTLHRYGEEALATGNTISRRLGWRTPRGAAGASTS